MKKKKEQTQPQMSGFAHIVDEGQDYPEVQPTSVETKSDVDLRFYTKEYSINAGEKKILATLVSRQEFRVFEKYLDWRVNACAHRMKAFLLDRQDDKAALEAAAIDSLVKVTQDMQNFWREAKIMDTDEKILLKNEEKPSLKPFGDEKYSINFTDRDETVGI